MKYDAIVLGAGSGRRSGQKENKVLVPLKDGKRIIEHSAALFSKDPDCEKVFAVCAPSEKEVFEALFARDPKVTVVTGGKERQDSVYAALHKAKSPWVMVHDGARPFASRDLIERLKEQLKTEKAVIPVLMAVDTIKQVDASGYVQKTLDRSSLVQVQTPQAFERPLLLSAFEKARAWGGQVTDDASLVEAFHMAPVKTIPGEKTNLKMTLPEDFSRYAL